MTDTTPPTDTQGNKVRLTLRQHDDLMRAVRQWRAGGRMQAIVARVESIVSEHLAARPIPAATHTDPAAQALLDAADVMSLWDEAELGGEGQLSAVVNIVAWLRDRAAQAPAPSPAIDAAHLARQREWSARTFGPGRRTGGVCDHIRKELQEIQDDPDDVREWVDVVILALDGAWRTGAEPQQIIDAIHAKQTRNEGRTWPDWRTMSEDQAIEHVRDGDA